MPTMNKKAGLPGWTFEFLDDNVEDEFDDFPVEIKAKMFRILELIKDKGLEHVRKPHVDHLGEKLWEMRAQGKDGWGRSLYCTASGRRVVILRCFMKKTNKTPKSEMKIAIERMKTLKQD